METAEVIEIIQRHITELQDIYKVSQMGMFGSFARGEATESSDVDILIDFSQAVGLFHFIDLQERLAQILGRKVDLGTDLKPIIKEKVMKEIIWIPGLTGS